MNLNLNKKIIILPGGIGLTEGFVKVIAAENAVPVIVGGKEADNLKMLESIDNRGFQVPGEPTNSIDFENAIKRIIERFDGIDGLVNNTGMSDSVGLENGNYEQFAGSLHKGLGHGYLITHFALPYLKKAKGAIVNVCLKTAQATGENIFSGGGGEALTREWAVELLPYSIRVNAVIVPERTVNITSFEKSEEIANIVAFLLSHKSSHTTGELIVVNQ